MADVNRFDQAARYFVRADPPAVLAWALDSPPADFRFGGWLDTRSVPFPGETDRVGDLVARVERADPPGEPWLVAVEVQIQPDPLMFGRLLEYLGRLWRAEKPSSERGDRYRLGAAVINLTGVGRASQDFEWLPTGPRTCLRVAERNPARESAADTLAAIVGGTRSPALLPLIPLMRGGGEPGIIEAWVRLASAESDSRRRSEHGALALVFARRPESGRYGKKPSRTGTWSNHSKSSNGRPKRGPKARRAVGFVPPARLSSAFSRPAFRRSPRN
jgi:hypothetical protein